MHKSPKKLILIIVLFLISLGLALFFFLNKTAVLDWFKGIGYNPTPAMLEMRDSLGLTTDGERIFNATHPLLASREDFNESCESHDESVSVLGCYTNDRIFIYNVEKEELPGIRESTSAHEFLHAVWTRLSGLEKSKLIPILEKTYSDHSEMKETVESYPEEERIGEVYVRLATQVKDLPDSLESHYAKYFKNQDSIVDYYDSYIAPFNELTETIDKLKAELETIEQDINDRIANLDARVEAFDQAVSEFNTCAETAGCFEDDWTFRTRRNELVLEQQVLNTDNDILNSLIDSYNQKVEEYNQNVLHSAELQNEINSNAPVKTIEE